jgi:hypothetical protein
VMTERQRQKIPGGIDAVLVFLRVLPMKSWHLPLSISVIVPPVIG